MGATNWKDTLLDPPVPQHVTPCSAPVRTSPGLAEFDDRLPTWDVDGIDDPSEEFDRAMLPDGFTLPDLPRWAAVPAFPTEAAAEPEHWWLEAGAEPTLDPAPPRQAGPEGRHLFRSSRPRLVAPIAPKAEPTDEVFRFMADPSTADVPRLSPPTAELPMIEPRPAGDWRIAASMALVALGAAQFLITVVLFPA